MVTLLLERGAERRAVCWPIGASATPRAWAKKRGRRRSPMSLEAQCQNGLSLTLRRLAATGKRLDLARDDAELREAHNLLRLTRLTIALTSPWCVIGATSGFRFGITRFASNRVI
jgi:hypothetical protein